MPASSLFICREAGGHPATSETSLKYQNIGLGNSQRSVMDLQPGFELRSARCPVFDGDRVAHVVFPDAVDLEVALGQAFEANAELLHNAPRGLVARDHRYLQTVKAQVVESELHRHDERFGRVALTGVALIDPVADVGILERASLDG